MRLVKRVALALVAVASAVAPLWVAPAAAADGDGAVGNWRTQARHGQVQIERCGASLCGKLVSSDNLRTNPDLRDINNKDEAKRSRRLKGLQILGSFQRDGDKWTNGSIYNPEDGGTYKATITQNGADTLKLKGCIVWPLCKTQTWTRIK